MNFKSAVKEKPDTVKTEFDKEKVFNLQETLLSKVQELVPVKKEGVRNIIILP